MELSLRNTQYAACTTHHAPRFPWRKGAVAMLLLVTTACGIVPLPRLVFDTPAPSATAGPPPTPLPSATITFKVHVPPGTPAGSAPAVQLLDEVGGGTRLIVLANTGDNLWSGGAPATIGSTLRYKYVRPRSASNCSPQ